MKKGDLKKFFSKFWYLVWKDDSLKGWIVSVIVLFVFIKFIFFPILNLSTGTNLPLAIVESCSMYHQGDLFSNYDNWWLRHENKYSEFDIDKPEFKDFKFKNGFTKGDILFITGTSPEKIKIGDVIIFNANQANPVIHRVISITQKQGKYYFSTIGDNNNGQLSIEKEISEDQLVGKAQFELVPYLGWVKLIFLEFQKPANQRGLCSEN